MLIFFLSFHCFCFVRLLHSCNHEEEQRYRYISIHHFRKRKDFPSFFSPFFFPFLLVHVFIVYCYCLVSSFYHMLYSKTTGRIVRFYVFGQQQRGQFRFINLFH